MHCRNENHEAGTVKSVATLPSRFTIQTGVQNLERPARPVFQASRGSHIIDQTRGSLAAPDGVTGFQVRLKLHFEIPF